MKKTILALAAVLALSGAAFAGTAQPSKHTPAPSICADSKINMKLDCGATGSVRKPGSVSDNVTADSKGPRLGIGTNPWIMPTTF
jgi:hypothetical protein